MYKLSIYYRGEEVTYLLSKHKEALEYVRSKIEEEYRKTKVNYVTIINLVGD